MPSGVPGGVPFDESSKPTVPEVDVYLGQTKLIHSLSSGIFEKVMRVGGHFHIS